MESATTPGTAPAHPLAIRFIQAAVVYLAIGVTMGVVMGASHDFKLHPVYAHVNLLGWTTLALAGIVYRLFPAAATTRLARVHFWLHNLALPPLMIGLALLLSGYEALDAVVGLGSVVLAFGLFAFVANVLLSLRMPAAAAAVGARARIPAVAP